MVLPKAPTTLFFLGLVLLLASQSWSQRPAAPKISEFAPAADLIQQVDFFIGRMEESLAVAADFDGAKQSRTLKDANTVAVLALMLAAHDEAHPLKASASAMLASSQALAAAADNFAQARAALDGIKAARAGTARDGARVKWEKAASLAALMKQVPLIHTKLKRGVDPNRLARQAAQSAGESAALAAIAEAAMLDTEHLKLPQDAEQGADQRAEQGADQRVEQGADQRVERWRQFCVQMRDAAGEVNAAIHALDQPRVAAGMKRLSQSCDACHAKFRSR